MDLPRWMWVVAGGCAVATAIRFDVWYPHRPLDPEPVGPPIVEAPMPQAASAGAAQPTYWHDPSVDPEALKRAFEPPPPLPTEARPAPVGLEPTEREWLTAQRRGRVIAN